MTAGYPVPPAAQKHRPAFGLEATPLWRRVAAFLVLFALSAFPVFAETAADDAAETAAPDPSLLCDSAAQAASRETGVPEAVLRAISLTETGRRRNGAFRPWPWTVNMEGAGRWFDTPEEAKAYVSERHASGARSYDVGCFQLNYRWHGEAFASLDEMFDPLANARYAAGFLARLYAETGSWSKAAGAYHSRTPSYAERYRTRFDRILANITDTPLPEIPPEDIALAAVSAAPEATAEEQIRVNTFPLLQANAGPGALGSLVPLSLAPGRRLIEPAATEEGAEDAG